MSATQTLKFDVENLSCAACVARVEKAARTVPGVTGARVNLAGRNAVLETKEGFDLAALADALKAANYPAREAEVTLTVDGLSCASCVARSEKVLKAQPGVIAAAVNLATREARIRYLEGSNTPQTLALALSATGYAATPGTGAAPADRTEAEIAQTRRLTLIAGILTLPVFLMEMGGHLFGFGHDILGPLAPYWDYIQFGLVTLVLFWPGRKFFQLGFPALLKHAPDMNSLVALGAGAAWAFSTLSLFAPSLLPAGSAAFYFEAAAVIVTLILMGRWLEARARGRTGAAIERLIGLQPRTARVEREGRFTEIPIEEVQPGDILDLRPGERVAVDGRVLEGRSHLDESMLTGEPMPVSKSKGDDVTAGTINGAGALRFQAEKVGADTVLARIIEMVAEAQGARLPVQALADKVVQIFVPIVMAIAGIAVGLWLIFGPAPTLGMALVAGVSVLIIACPCAMGLATPVSVMVGVGRAAEMGVLFRKGSALQDMAGAQVVAFDKTGTLTEGRAALAQVQLAAGQVQEEVLRLIAAAEARSEHPIARAIIAAAPETLPEASDFNAIPGYGLEARVDGHRLLIGNRRLMERENIALEGFDETTLTGRGETPVYAAMDGKLVALLGIADPLKAESRAVIKALKAQGLQVAMLTGDTENTARAIAGDLGIDLVHAGLLPGDKSGVIEDLQKRGPVAFVGDGINDAPALARADIGIGMGSGTEVAIEAADIVLMSGALSGVINARAASVQTMRNIRQNLFWAFAYNAALIPVAAGGLYPFTGHLLSPMLAAGAMALSSVFVLSNALRLRRMRPVMEVAQ